MYVKVQHWSFPSAIHMHSEAVLHLESGDYLRALCDDHTCRVSAEARAFCAAITFMGIGVFDVGLQVMLGRLDRLADSCFVSGLSRAEIVELLKSRLKPFPVP